MKLLDLEHHLRANGCECLREGGNDSIWWNPALRRSTSVPHHREVNDFTARKICRDLGIPTPSR